MFLKLKAQHDKVNSFKFLDLGTVKQKKIKSICLESEPILEELEEYYPGNDIDVRNHTFYVPLSRNRQDSIDLPSSNNLEHIHENISSNMLAPIIEKKEEPEEDPVNVP